MPRSLYHRGESPGYSFTRRLDWPQSRSWPFGREKSLLALPRIGFVCCPALSLHATRTELSWFLIYSLWWRNFFHRSSQWNGGFSISPLKVISNPSTLTRNVLNSTFRFSFLPTQKWIYMQSLLMYLQIVILCACSLHIPQRLRYLSYLTCVCYSSWFTSILQPIVFCF